MSEMVLSKSLEDYLEVIYHIVVVEQAAKAKDIAQKMQVKASSVTGALRQLAERDLVNYSPYDQITLTRKGMEVAQDVVNYIDQISSRTNAEGLPILTGALHDASGVGIYCDGALSAYRPRQIYNSRENSGQMLSPEDMLDYTLS